MFVIPGSTATGRSGSSWRPSSTRRFSVGIALLLPYAAIGVLGPLRLVGGLVFGTLILWLVGQVVPGYRVEGLAAALLGALMVSAAMYAASAIFAFVPLLRRTRNLPPTSSPDH